MYTDADLELADLTAAGNLGHAAKAAGWCPHWSSITATATNTVHRPADMPLGSELCRDCGRTFASRTEMDADGELNLADYRDTH